MIKSQELMEFIQKRDRKRGKQTVAYNSSLVNNGDSYEILKEILRMMVDKKDDSAEMIAILDYFLKKSFNSGVIKASGDSIRKIGNSIIYTNEQFFVQIPLSLNETLLLGRPKCLEKPDFVYDEEKEKFATVVVEFFQAADLENKKSLKKFLVDNSSNPFITNGSLFETYRRIMEKSFFNASNFLVTQDESMKLISAYNDREYAEAQFLENTKELVEFFEKKGLTIKPVNMGI